MPSKYNNPANTMKVALKANNDFFVLTPGMGVKKPRKL